MSPAPLVLASTSPRRRELLAGLGLAFETQEAGVDERVPGVADPVAVARKLARRKARAVAHHGSGEMVLAADTVVALGERLLGKPGDAEEAAAMLRQLSGRWHEVITAVALALPGGPPCVGHATTRVRLRQLEASDIEAYVASGQPLDKAGAYGIQDREFDPVERCEGCYCNVMGLPLWLVTGMLRQGGVSVPVPPDQFAQRCAPCPLRLSA